LKKKIYNFKFVIPKNMPLIETKNLEKTYFGDKIETRVLRGITLSINKGEFVSIMGPSGSGKSTLLHILGFLDELSGGSYAFDGKTFDEYKKEEIAHVRNKKMGFIFQTFNLLPRTSVLENVKLPLLYSGIEESLWGDMARKAIESVGLSHRINHNQSQLSGGERQRVAIARALVNNPNVIFADEPTGNLDSKSGEQIMDIISSLHKKGHTILLITHESYTAKYAERIIHINDGKITKDERVTPESRNSHFKK
jgi:putative ABC transport system ATP-binding protein